MIYTTMLRIVIPPWWIPNDHYGSTMWHHHFWIWITSHGWPWPDKSIAAALAPRLRYRDSKLTQLLRNCLGGNARTVAAGRELSAMEKTVRSYWSLRRLKQIWQCMALYGNRMIVIMMIVIIINMIWYTMITVAYGNFIAVWNVTVKPGEWSRSLTLILKVVFIVVIGSRSNRQVDMHNPCATRSMITTTRVYCILPSYLPIIASPGIFHPSQSSVPSSLLPIINTN